MVSVTPAARSPRRRPLLTAGRHQVTIGAVRCGQTAPTCTPEMKASESCAQARRRICPPSACRSDSARHRLDARATRPCDQIRRAAVETKWTIGRAGEVPHGLHDGGPRMLQAGCRRHRATGVDQNHELERRATHLGAGMGWSPTCNQIAARSSSARATRTTGDPRSATALCVPASGRHERLHEPDRMGHSPARIRRDLPASWSVFPALGFPVESPPRFDEAALDWSGRRAGQPLEGSSRRAKANK